MSAAVGADIESLCAKCGDVWHVVVAKVGERIAKVQCKQCHAFHRHKPPPGKEARKSGVTVTAPATATAAKVKAAAKPRATRKKPAEPEPPAVLPDLSRPVRRYSPAENYTSGDRITHPTFGQGVVEGSTGAGRIQVAFADGRRVLAVAKAASTLDRPTNRPHD